MASDTYYFRFSPLGVTSGLKFNFIPLPAGGGGDSSGMKVADGGSVGHEDVESQPAPGIGVDVAESGLV